MIIRIDHKLRVAHSQLPPEILESIVEALTIPNVERQKAMEQNLWGWEQLPEKIALWQWSRNAIDLVMPRGFLLNLIRGLSDLNVPYEAEDNRVFDNTGSPMGEKIMLHTWQMPAVNTMILHEQGIWKAPPASGKTVAVLELIRRLNCPAIILVNTKDILYQWKTRAKQFLGEDFPVGLIGDGHFQISDYLTVATVQTLESRYEDLDQNGFFEQFSFVCLDECHHATAQTYNKILGRFSAKYRIGVSATPDKTGDFALAENVLGPIIHETDPEVVKTLIRPDVIKIPTRFMFEYRGREGRKPSNYPQLIQSLITDQDRNRIIAKSIAIECNGHSLVVSKRLEHIELLIQHLKAWGYMQPIYRLTGKESSYDRQLVIEAATEYPCAIFSTLADEALDIPRLDRLFLVYPQRNPGLIEQQVGRIRRWHPNKKDAKVFDFSDTLVGPLDAQWKVRRLQVYQPQKFEISTVNPDDILEFDLKYLT